MIGPRRTNDKVDEIRRNVPFSSSSRRNQNKRKVQRRLVLTSIPFEKEIPDPSTISYREGRA